MKRIVLEPMIADENVIVQFTDTFIADKSTSIKVPNGYRALVFADENVAFRINAGAPKKISESGKEYIGKECRVAFVRTKLLPNMMWGFGNIQVNNERLKEAYRVGTNGKYSVEIAETGKLMRCFDTEENITLDMLREKTVSVLRMVGTTLLGKYFAATDISVFEMSAHTDELRQALIKALSSESVFGELGLKLKDLTVDGIHVNEEDLELIRNRING